MSEKMTTNGQEPHLYRRLATVGNAVTDIEPLVLELAGALLGIEKLPGPWDAKACLEKLASRERLSNVALTLWLADDDKVQCAKQLLRVISVRSVEVREEPALDISGLPLGKVALCASRLCSLFTSTVLSLRWTLALAAASEKQDPEVMKFAVELMRYHVEEFPRTTRELLTQCSTAYKVLDLAASALAHLEAEEKRLLDFSFMPELAMNDSMRIAVSSHERNQQREILRGADERGLFAQLFTRQYFKYSREVAFQVHAGGKVHEQSMQMPGYSVSIELPMSEALDPQMGAQRRRRLWIGQS